MNYNKLNEAFCFGRLLLTAKGLFFARREAVKVCCAKFHYTGRKRIILVRFSKYFNFLKFSVDKWEILSIIKSTVLVKASDEAERTFENYEKSS